MEKKGNIIQYDSTYSYSYFGNLNKSEKVDSIIKHLQNEFDLQKFNNQSFNNDSLDNFFSFSPFCNDSAFKQPNNIDKIMKSQIEALMKEHENMMKLFFDNEFFNYEPVLKVPDDNTPDNFQYLSPQKESFKPEIVL